MSPPAVVARLTGTGVVAIEIPMIKRLLERSSVSYLRPRSVLVEARRATVKDMESPLITFVTDCHGDLLTETSKTFSKTEIDSGIIILRYPDAICGKQYNEWYVTRKEWEEKYVGNPGEGFVRFQSRKEVWKLGLDISPEVIELLGGKDGRAEISPSWGGTMWALEGGLLTKDGTAIAPQILERYYVKMPDAQRD